jgi:hypothetical protein
MKRTSVGVSPASEYDRQRRLLDALERLFPVTFSAVSDLAPVEAVLLLDATRESARQIAQTGIPCYAVVTGSTSNAAATVEFAQNPELEDYLRGLTLADLECCLACSLPATPGEMIMATKGGQPFWLHQPAQGQAGALDLVGLSLPILAANDYLAALFYREKYLQLLPLIHWVKRITKGNGFAVAPRRACLVFDDPSLPKPTYGCLNFSVLAAHAREWNYHAVVATVPLSSRRVSRENAKLFREQTRHISLIIHGNDHVQKELARDYPEPERLAILAQAWQRMADMEQKHGIRIGRIMEAPYGVIAAGMVEPLVRLGYEATLITPGQFLPMNRQSRFPVAIGLAPAECLGAGLCILPRIKLTPQWKTDAVLALLLGQPIIIVGHHYDAAGGLELMRDIASTLNDWSGMQWMSLPEIVRSQFQSRLQDGVLTVRLGSRRIMLDVPPGVREIVVERPWLNEDSAESLLVRAVDGSAPERQWTGGAEVGGISSLSGRIEIQSAVPLALNPAMVPARSVKYWPLVRRALMETRDRLYPYTHRQPTTAKPVRMNSPRTA